MHENIPFEHFQRRPPMRDCKPNRLPFGPKLSRYAPFAGMTPSIRRVSRIYFSEAFRPKSSSRRIIGAPPAPSKLRRRKERAAGARRKGDVPSAPHTAGQCGSLPLRTSSQRGTAIYGAHTPSSVFLGQKPANTRHSWECRLCADAVVGFPRGNNIVPQSHAGSLELQCEVSPAHDTRHVGPQANGSRAVPTSGPEVKLKSVDKSFKIT
jgi:hypothetical protein